MCTDPPGLTGRPEDREAEHAPDEPLRRPGPGWRKSSYSGGVNDCVWVARASDGGVLLGDSRTPEGPVIRVTDAAWCVFLQALNSTDLD